MATSKRIFMTGASGYIGLRIIAFALEEGYTVHGLSRSPSSDAKLTALGAVPVRGDLSSHDVLRRESAAADAVIHLADAWLDNINDIRGYAAVVAIDGAAVDALAAGLAGTQKPFLVTSATSIVQPDPRGGETDEEGPARGPATAFNNRVACEGHALGLAAQGIQVCAVRLPPYVYGGGSSWTKMFMGVFAGLGEALYAGAGATCVTTVHVDDAARLYLLLLAKANTGVWKAGEVFNATARTDRTGRELVEAMAEALGVPARSVSFEELAEKGGETLAKFMTVEDRSNSAKAMRVLGWQPREIDILEDIKTGSYQAVAKELMEAAAKK
ncbi:hypothetical protein F4810DRAFT_659144 [Camillea tinctor]|nr:hypothetical protein F4810DRAFT_659144 [Camillea tinctor]